MKANDIYANITETEDKLSFARGQLEGIKTLLNEARESNKNMEFISGIEDAQDLVLNHINELKFKLKRLIRIANRDAERRER